MDEKQQRMVMLSIGVASMWPVLLSVGSKSGRSLLTEQLRIHLCLRFYVSFSFFICQSRVLQDAAAKELRSWV